MADINDFMSNLDRPQQPGSVEDFMSGLDRKADPFGTAVNTWGTSLKNAALNDPIVGPVSNAIFGQGPFHDIAKAFGQSTQDTFDATKLSPDVEKTMQKFGLLEDYNKQQTDALTSFNEAFFRPVFTGLLKPTLDAPATGLGVLQGVGTGVETFGRRLMNTATDVRDKIGKYDPTGMVNAGAQVLGGAGEIIGAVPSGFLPELHIPEFHILNKDRANGVIGSGGESAYFGTKAPTAEQMAATTDALRNMGPPKSELNVDQVARLNAPGLMSDWDKLTDTRDRLRKQLTDLEPGQMVDNPDRVNVQTKLNDWLAKVDGDESKLSKNHVRDVAEARELLGELPEKIPSEDVAGPIRQQMLENDVKMRDMSKDVDYVNRIAAGQLESLHEPLSSPYDRFQTGLEEDIAPEVGPSEKGSDSSVDTHIQDDVTSKLIGAGRPEAEARAAGAVVQAYYETRAKDFAGRRGDARKMYESEAPEIVKSAFGTKIRGRQFNQYAGVRAAVADKARFNTAVQMEQSGVSPDKIRLATGWFKGKFDHKWRFEVSDAGADLHTQWGQLPETKPLSGDTYETTLEHVLAHPSLYEAYPEAKDIKITKQGGVFDIWQTYQGWFDKEKNLINVTPYAKNQLSTLLHEVQHWIQGKEGFAKGGNAQTVLDNMSPERRQKLFEDAITNVRDKLSKIPDELDLIKRFESNFDVFEARQEWLAQQELYREYKEVAGLDVQDPVRKHATDAWLAQEDRVKKIRDDVAKEYFGTDKWYDIPKDKQDLFYALRDTWEGAKPADIQTIIDGSKKKIVDLNELETKLQSGDVKALKDALDGGRIHKLYESIAGEIEARDTQARQGLTDPERLEKEPYSSQTYDPEDVTVNYGQGRRGSIEIRNTKNLIRLFAKADASTFMHETGHDWLERLAKDALDPEAPEHYSAALDTVKTWYNERRGKSGPKWLDDGKIPVKAHEMWARGFERYLYEGRVPTAGLAKAFELFRQWLTKLYKSVAKLKAPISDDIRDVYARLLSDRPTSGGIALDELPDTAAHQPTLKATPDPTVTKAQPGTSLKTPDNVPRTSDSPITFDQSSFMEPSGKIKWENVSSDDTLSGYMKDFADLNNDFLAARKGNLTVDDRLEMADYLAENPSRMRGNVTRLYNMFVKDEIPVDVRFYSLKEALKQNTQRLVDLAKDNDAVGFAEASLMQTRLQNAFAGVRTTWGRIGLELQKDKGLIQVERVNMLLQTTIGKTLEQVQRDMIRIGEYDTAAKVNKYLKSSYGEMALEAFKNYLISGPLTHFSYLAGNEIFTMVQVVPETGAAAVVGKIREAITGKKSLPGQKVEFGEVGAGLYGMLYGHKNGWKAAKQSFLEGQTTPLQGEDLAATPFSATQHIPNFENVGGSGVNIPLGSALRFAGERMVAPIHSFNRTVNFFAFRDQIIFRTVSGEGLEPGSVAFRNRVAELQNFTPESILRQARDKATEGALMGPSGKFLKTVQAVTTYETELPLIGKIQPLSFIDPFVHVAGNVNRLAAERTPLGFIFKNVRDDIAGKNGTLAQDTAIAKMALGSSLFAAVGGLYATGVIQPGRPKDYKQAAADLYVKGLPHSVRIGGMTYAFDRLGIVGTQLSLMTDFWSAINHGWNERSFSAGASEFVSGMLEHLSSEGFLSGFSDMFKAADEPDKYGQGWVNNLITNISVPYSVGLGQVARQVDPFSRRYHGFLETVESKIPGLSERLEPRIDIWGQEVPNKEFLGVYAQQAHDDPLSQYLAEKGWWPAPAGKKINGVELTETQQTQYARQRGVLLRQFYQNVFGLQNLRQMPEEQQHELFSQWERKATTQAQNTLAAMYRGTEHDVSKQARINKESLVGH